MAEYAKDVLVETDWVEQHLNDDNIRIIEVDENPALYAEAHIPGAASIPWAQAVKEDGTFKSADDLRELYSGKGVLDGGAGEIIAYCRIGERSAHTWFVLHEILGQANVKNYDGSWTEYGSLVGVPIELGDAR